MRYLACSVACCYRSMFLLTAEMRSIEGRRGVHLLREHELYVGEAAYASAMLEPLT